MRPFRALLLVMSALLVTTAAWSASGRMSVQVRSSELRSSPSFLGASVAIVGYGEQVEVVSQQGNWMEVYASSGTKGWIHQSALTKKKVVLRPGGADVETGASEEELALAGKGFSADVEKEFRLDHADIDFNWVDRMEQMKFSPQELISFLTQGGLQPQEGGAK
jgi:uncharacterized protein YgiM (DUF1202 family)